MDGSAINFGDRLDMICCEVGCGRLRVLEASKIILRFLFWAVSDRYWSDSLHRKEWTQQIGEGGMETRSSLSEIPMKLSMILESRGKASLHLTSHWF